MAVMKETSAAGCPARAAPSVSPGPSAPQGARQKESTAMPPAGTPPIPIARSAPRVKTAPTPKPAMLSTKAPARSMA